MDAVPINGTQLLINRIYNGTHFIAYKVFKELKRIIRLKSIRLSVDKLLEAAKIIITNRVNMVENGKVYIKTRFFTEKHQKI